MQEKTVPCLFARVQPAGDERCYYCGAACGRERLVKSAAFTGQDSVRRPGSRWQCDGCAACMQESASVRMLAGGTRQRQKVRNYSWVVTAHTARAATKADRAALRRVCLSPPAPPFAIVLADSGQKHLLYRAVVNLVRDPTVVTLEASPIVYRRDDLRSRLRLVDELVLALGRKGPLYGDFSRSAGCRLVEQLGEGPLTTWQRVREEPLSQLAVWLVSNPSIPEEPQR